MRTSGDFDAFYQASYGRLLGQLFAMVGSRSEAEDALAEAYARAWQRWPTVGGYEDPESWVRRVAYRIGVSAWRKTVARAAAHRRHGASDDVPAVSPDHLALADALNRIPDHYRRVIVLRYLVGLSVEEISREVSAPASTVKSRLARGRRALAGYVSELADEADATPAQEVRRHG